MASFFIAPNGIAKILEITLKIGFPISCATAKIIR